MLIRSGNASLGMRSKCVVGEAIVGVLSVGSVLCKFVMTALCTGKVNYVTHLSLGPTNSTHPTKSHVEIISLVPR